MIKRTQTPETNNYTGADDLPSDPLDNSVRPLPSMYQFNSIPIDEGLKDIDATPMPEPGMTETGEPVKDTNEMFANIDPVKIKKDLGQTVLNGSGLNPDNFPDNRATSQPIATQTVPHAIKDRSSDKTEFVERRREFKPEE